MIITWGLCCCVSEHPLKSPTKPPLGPQYGWGSSQGIQFCLLEMTIHRKLDQAEEERAPEAKPGHPGFSRTFIPYSHWWQANQWWLVVEWKGREVSGGSRNRKQQAPPLVFTAKHGFPISISTVLQNPPQQLPLQSALALERKRRAVLQDAYPGSASMASVPPEVSLHLWDFRCPSWKKQEGCSSPSVRSLFEQRLEQKPRNPCSRVLCGVEPGRPRKLSSPKLRDSMGPGVCVTREIMVWW